MGEEYDKFKALSLADGSLDALKELANKFNESVHIEELDKLVGAVKRVAEVIVLLFFAVTYRGD